MFTTNSAGIFKWLLAMIAAAQLIACASNPQPKPSNERLYQARSLMNIENPVWSKDAAIYQLNVRQFTQEGTLQAAMGQLPRIKALGAKIVWLMPIHPIGEVNRKGELGSPYSIKNYFEVNPEFGTFDDLKAFVDAAHEQGMYVILDWVANHTAWDNPMRAEHPEWYERDADGNFTSTPWFDWDDIIDLDYSQPGLREYMGKAMHFWVEKAGVDGYRCDAAGLVPLSFWQDVRTDLEQIKPVFMLAEWEGRDFHYQAFDATYAWGWWKAMHGIASGHSGMGKLYEFYSWNTGYYPAGAMRLNYVSNHDSNAWEATQFEAFGDALEATIALSVIGEGIPMIYNGQEAGNTKRLKFFEHDPIEWKSHPVGELYRKLFMMKKQHSVLWNGKWGAPMVQVKNNNGSHVLSFIRQNDSEKMLALFNLSATAQSVMLTSDYAAGEYQNALTGEATSITTTNSITLKPWDFVILFKQP